MRSTPNLDTDENIVGSLAYEDVVEVIGEENGFAKIYYGDGAAYCYMEFLVRGAERLYAEVPAETKEAVDPATNLPVLAADGVTPRDTEK